MTKEIKVAIDETSLDNLIAVIEMFGDETIFMLPQNEYPIRIIVNDSEEHSLSLQKIKPDMYCFRNIGETGDYIFQYPKSAEFDMLAMFLMLKRNKVGYLGFPHCVFFDKDEISENCKLNFVLWGY